MRVRRMSNRIKSSPSLLSQIAPSMRVRCDISKCEQIGQPEGEERVGGLRPVCKHR